MMEGQFFPGPPLSAPPARTALEQILLGLFTEAIDVLREYDTEKADLLNTKAWDAIEP